jgi:hypothetical protein
MPRLDSICNGLMAYFESSPTPLHHPTGMVVDSDVVNCATSNSPHSYCGGADRSR